LIDLSAVTEGPGQLARDPGQDHREGWPGPGTDRGHDRYPDSVFGKTVALISLPEQIRTAHTAIDMLVSGVPHENVFAFLDKKKKEAKQNVISYYY
jgi:ribosomal RNA assembly protein